MFKLLIYVVSDEGLYLWLKLISDCETDTINKHTDKTGVAMHLTQHKT